ncbi:MAG: hypothetical protein JNN15_21500, partial [Blastocatellia bacterium]|nr:hypothetical protein [Blastocatellia bacterium]
NDRVAQQVADKIGESDPLLGQELKKMIKNFQLDELLDLIERIPT